MRRKSREHMCKQVGRWHEAALIDSDTLLLLNERYDAQNRFLATLLKWIGMFAIVQLGLAVLAFIGMMTESRTVAAVILGGIGFVAWRFGAKMSTDPLRRHPFTGAVLITAGLAAGFGCLVLIFFKEDGGSLPPIMLVASLACGFTAYRYYLRYPLLLGLLFFFHGIGFEHAYLGHGGYASNIHDPKVMAIIGLVTAIVGMWHEQVLERDKLHRAAGFGRLYLIFGLLYLNISLWFLTIPEGTFGTILIFATAGIVQIVVGTGRNDSRLTGFGIVFLAINIYTRLFETMWDRMSQGSLFMVAGLLGIVLGFAFERHGLSGIFRRKGKDANSTLSRLVHRELDSLLREGVLDPIVQQRVLARYPRSAWNWQALGRWFLIFGAVCTASGAAILAPQIFELSLTDLAGLLLASILGLFWTANAIKRRRPMPWTTRCLELLGAFCLIGLTFTLGIIYSSGSGNWPALLLIDLVLILALAYLLNNVLLLTLSSAVFFIWFGGFTGYVSGWGMYFFGMNFPLRFFLIAIPIALIGAVHLRAEDLRLNAFRGFGKVWLSSGLFFGQMALWLLSLFGNFGNVFSDFHMASGGELFLFNTLWAGVNGGLIYLGARHGVRMLNAYGFTFLIIQSYTLFFTHLAESLGTLLSLLLAGGSALFLAFYLEKKRREQLQGA